MSCYLSLSELFGIILSFQYTSNFQIFIAFMHFFEWRASWLCYLTTILFGNHLYLNFRTYFNNTFSDASLFVFAWNLQFWEYCLYFLEIIYFLIWYYLMEDWEETKSTPSLILIMKCLHLLISLLFFCLTLTC
jgi:hypothetical protein